MSLFFYIFIPIFQVQSFHVRSYYLPNIVNVIKAYLYTLNLFQLGEWPCLNKSYIDLVSSDIDLNLKGSGTLIV